MRRAGWLRAEGNTSSVMSYILKDVRHATSQRNREDYYTLGRLNRARFIGGDLVWVRDTASGTLTAPLTGLRDDVKEAPPASSAPCCWRPTTSGNCNTATCRPKDDRT